MKILLRIVLVLVLVLVALVGLGVATLDSTVARIIEEGGTYAMGVDTNVESTDVGVLSGEFSMTGLTVANPEGFTTPAFLGVRGAATAVDLGTVRSEKIVAPLLELDGVDLHLERRDGKTNYGVILENLAHLGGEGGGGEPSEPAPSEGPSQAFLVERIVLRDITATIDLLPVAGDASKVTLGLEELEITDLDTEGLAMAELFDLVIQTLLAATLQAGDGLLPADLLQDLGGKLQGLEGAAFQLKGELKTEVEGALEAKKDELIQEATDRLKELGGEAGKQLGETLGSEVDQQLKGLFKKKD